jgi:lipoprotein-anchoring transpeptidase ErfK/SrfK
MRGNSLWQLSVLPLILSTFVSGCASTNSTNQNMQIAQADPAHMPLYMHDPVATDLPPYQGQAPYSDSFDESKYVARLPRTIDYSSGKVLLFDPKAYAWGAYDDGVLVRGGIAQGGADVCRDTQQPCRTKPGIYHIFSMGDASCYSREFPVHKGGALMPYCMFFNEGQSFHGTPDQMLTMEANISHGCVHMRIPDAAWLRYDFVQKGTKVVILPYGDDGSV